MTTISNPGFQEHLSIDIDDPDEPRLGSKMSNTSSNSTTVSATRSSDELSPLKTGSIVIAGNCRIGLFADGIILWCSDSDIDRIESSLNNTSQRIQDFDTDHKLCFNPLKSVTGLFTTNRHLYRYSPRISLNGHILQYERNPKYLGFVLDPEITYNKHIDLLLTKAKKRLNILKFICG
ncbi:hypothetical protein AVEN_263583-1 [Araneus ventricosus]|uniref:Reverse transcriptase domain-containing protein n=1 Tax=Araneus ventricosus TaxID=182803 RepID=A0A4Y2TVF1_ARAVE|nr:hypothetical protein AVEN_263583-1 [Araneus ventricosus]